MRRLLLHRRAASRLVTVALCSAVADGAAAQSVLVAPNVIVIDGRTRTTAITLVNAGNAPAEVTLGTAFGYPVTDSLGVMRLRTFDATADEPTSAANFVRAYPSSFMLPVGARRIVRLMATPSDTIRDGEYWARLVVTTRAARARARAASGDDAGGGARIGLDLELRSLLPLFYRSGAVRTGVTTDSVLARRAGDSLDVRVFMRRTGNAAFVGSVRAQLRDGTGSIVATSVLPLGVYNALAPRLALPCRGLTAGTYDLQVDAVSQRDDVLPSLLLRAPTVSRRIAIRLDGTTP